MTDPAVWIALHDLSRTGVPVSLARLLGALGPEQRRCVHVVALHDGPLRAELEALVPRVTVLAPASGRSSAGAVGVGLASLGLDLLGDRVAGAPLRRLRRSGTPDVLVLYGAGAWAARLAAGPAVPVVVHLHELDSALDRCIPRTERAALFGRAARVLAVCGPVADLAVRSGAAAERVEVVPGVVVDTPTPPTDAAAAELGRGRWLLGAGRPGWRKGTDRMAAIAWELRRRSIHTDVGWVGGAPADTDAAWVEAEDPVRWFPERADPWQLLIGAAALVVPSREDPLPLVALEAGLRGMAVVATETGGLASLLAEGRGLVADGQRLDSLVDRVVEVLDAPERAAAMGAALREHVREHHLAEVVAPRWWDAVTDAACRGPSLGPAR